jgi:two-component system, chemotaxis family, protein-glutamate methylesterase/glutaminase
MASKPVRILIAEDDPTSAFVLESMLKREGYDVVTVGDGEQAYEAIQKENFAAILTDWMMPHMDGMELIRKVRETIQPVPAILMITSISMPSAVEHSLQSGADDYIVKPYMPQEVLAALNKLLAIQEEAAQALSEELAAAEAIKNQAAAQSSPAAGAARVAQSASGKPLPPFLGVGITTNTGGPNALSKLFQEMPNTNQAVFLVLLQAPVWALEMFVMRLQKVTPLKVTFAEDGAVLNGGSIYVARKDRHLIVQPNGKLQYLDTSEINHYRPSADILFKSMADVFGSRSIGVGLTGIGRDGLSGMAHIAAAGGRVVVQDPSTADSPYFPQAVLNLKINASIATLPNIAKGLVQLAQKA